MNDYNVVLATDNNYLPYSFVACQSIIDSLESSSAGGQTVSNDDRIIFNLSSLCEFYTTLQVKAIFIE